MAFAPSAARARSATLHLVNRSTNPTIATYDIQFTGRAVSSADDSDGDGLNDAAETRAAGMTKRQLLKGGTRLAMLREAVWPQRQPAIA